MCHISQVQEKFVTNSIVLIHSLLVLKIHLQNMMATSSFNILETPKMSILSLEVADHGPERL